MHNITFVQKGGQINLPASIRQIFNLQPGSAVKLSVVENSIVVEPAKDGSKKRQLRIKPLKISDKPQGSPWLKEAYEAFADVRKQTEKYTSEEINEAIDKAVKAVRRSHAKGGI